MATAKSPTVLDASALLAVALSEPGSDRVIARMSGAFITAINLAEVLYSLARHGVPLGEAAELAGQLDLRVVEVAARHAPPAAALQVATRARGLSLADCFCLAIAAELGAEVLTADRAWAKLEVGVPITIVRN